MFHVEAGGPFAADYFQAPRSETVWQLCPAGERHVDILRKCKMRFDFISCDWSNILVCLPCIACRDVASVFRDSCRAPNGIAGDKPDHVKQMHTEHDHVFAARAMILFSPAPNLLHLAQQT